MDFHGFLPFSTIFVPGLGRESQGPGELQPAATDPGPCDVHHQRGRGGVLGLGAADASGGTPVEHRGKIWES